MKISIAMCTHNGARYLPEQLASFVAQSRPPDEVVICDDNSTDESLSILNDFVKAAPFSVTVRHNKTRLGSTKNFEQAISLCTGDVIALSDQDDYWQRDKLAFMEERFKRRPEVGLIFCDAELVDENGQPLGQRLWEAAGFNSALKSKIRSTHAYEVFDRRELIAGMTMAFQARFKELILPFPENTPLIHDGWIALMISHSSDLDFIEQPLVNYRQHSSQQLGAPRFDTNSKSTASRIIESARRSSSFEHELSRIRDVLPRMNACAGKFEFRGRKNLAALYVHFQTRRSASQNKVTSFPSVFRELAMGRYHRYSNGLGSFLKDLLT